VFEFCPKYWKICNPIYLNNPPSLVGLFSPLVGGACCLSYWHQWHGMLSVPAWMICIFMNVNKWKWTTHVPLGKRMLLSVTRERWNYCQLKKIIKSRWEKLTWPVARCKPCKICISTLVTPIIVIKCFFLFYFFTYLKVKVEITLCIWRVKFMSQGDVTMKSEVP